MIVTQSAEICSFLPNEDGTLTLIDTEGKPVGHESYNSVGYMRRSGKPKILRSVVRKPDDGVGENPWLKYDKIGFVDTNSQDQGGRRLFVCSPSLLLWQDASRSTGNVHHVDLLVGYCANESNPERAGWFDFVQRVQESGVLEATDRILLVVDSEKAAIPRINGRIQPIFGDFVLPELFTMAYATSDAGAENWINAEMRRRDRVAARAMASIRADKRFLEILSESGSLYIKNTFER